MPCGVVSPSHLCLYITGLLSEDQCKARDARRKSKQKPVIKKEAPSPDSHEHGVEAIDLRPEPVALRRSSSISFSQGDSSSDTNPLMKMPLHHQETVKNLLLLQEKYEFPEEDAVKRATVCDHNGWRRVCVCVHVDGGVA